MSMSSINDCHRCPLFRENSAEFYCLALKRKKQIASVPYWGISLYCPLGELALVAPVINLKTCGENHVKL